MRYIAMQNPVRGIVCRMIGMGFAVSGRMNPFLGSIADQERHKFLINGFYSVVSGSNGLGSGFFWRRQQLAATLKCRLFRALRWPRASGST